MRRARSLVLGCALLALACKKAPAPAVPSAVVTDRRCDGASACPADHFCAPSGRCVVAATAVTAGAGHSCALHRNGRVTCWGYGNAVLGQGARAKGDAGEVLGAREITGLHDVRAVAAGFVATCAVTGDDRQVRCFGQEDFTLREDSGAPITGVAAVALGPGFGCASARAGVYCWGRNEHGQLARPLAVKGSSNAVLARAGHSPLLGAGLAVVTGAPGGKSQLCAWGNNSSLLVAADQAEGAIGTPSCREVPAVAELAVGAGHACVRHDKGGISCWGERYYGQLGTGSPETSDVPAPGEEVVFPAPARAIAAGAGHTCVLIEDGRVLCFGLNDVGQVGAAALHVRSPYLRDGLPGKAIALGSGSTARHTCAVLHDGAVACWGHDHTGQLGGDPRTRQEDRFSARPVAVRF